MQIEITFEYLASQGLSNTFPQNFWKKVDKNGPIPTHRPELGQCWRWTGVKSGGCNRGYGYIGKITAQRASWMIHKGPIPDRLFVLHQCDNPECTNPDHLFLGTAKQNTQDMMQKGRVRTAIKPRGRNGKTVWETVALIRAAYIPWIVTRKQLAERFGIPVGVVKCIVNHKTFKTSSPHSKNT